MFDPRTRRAATTACALSLALAACGGGTEPDAAVTTAPTVSGDSAQEAAQQPAQEPAQDESAPSTTNAVSGDSAQEPAQEPAQTEPALEEPIAPIETGGPADALLTGDVATITGGTLDLASLRGTDVVLWFWAPW